MDMRPNSDTRSPKPAPARRGLILGVSCAILGALLAAPLGGCRETRPAQPTRATAQCDLEPTGTVTALLVGPEPVGAATFTGTVSSFPAPVPYGLSRLVVHDEGGVDHTISYQLPGLTLPIQEGGVYTFLVDHQGRFPPASALLIWDANGLLFAGMSDIGWGSMVLPQGIEGFEVQLLPTSCGTRPHDECYESLKNALLRVTHAGHSAELFHGESVDLGDYHITCLTAQQAVLSTSCADATPINLSFVIARTAPVR